MGGLEAEVRALREAQGALEEELATLHAVNARLAEENAELSANADTLASGEAAQQLSAAQAEVSRNQHAIHYVTCKLPPVQGSLG